VGCRTPVAGHATIEPGDRAGEADGRVLLRALVGRPDASEMIRDELAGPPDRAAALGAELSRRLLARGADRILRELEHAT
jgi:hydroxymethylbilane synthase